MTKRRKQILGGLGLAICFVGAAIAIFFHTFERGTDMRYRAASLEAAQNPYLAWERLLVGMGHEVRRIQQPRTFDSELPPTDAAIFYPINRLTLGEERSARLLEWAEQGGHLWVVTWSLWENESRLEDPILDRLGVHQHRAHQDDLATMLDEIIDPEEVDTPETPTEENDSSQDEEEWEWVPQNMLQIWPAVNWESASFTLNDEERTLSVYFDEQFWLEFESVNPSLTLAGESGTHLARLPVGKGFITVMTDDYFIRNDALVEAAHAEIALRVLRTDQERSVVWLVLSEQWPSLSEIVWHNGWTVLIGAVCCLFAWLWRSLIRFGPWIPEEAPVRRSLLEHVEASGRLLARYHPDALIHASREALHESLRARRPSWLRLSPSEQIERLAKISSLPPEEVAIAWREGDGSGKGRSHLSRVISTLERIRRSI